MSCHGDGARLELNGSVNCGPPRYGLPGVNPPGGLRSLLLSARASGQLVGSTTKSWRLGNYLTFHGPSLRRWRTNQDRVRVPPIARPQQAVAKRGNASVSPVEDLAVVDDHRSPLVHL